MKGDFTRFTHDPKKHYSKVLKQQGRVDLDSDWNENAEIQQHLMHTTNKDVIGLCGVPKEKENSFSLEWDGEDLLISPGRIYVNGILCELEEPEKGEWVRYSNQPDYPNKEILDPEVGRTDLVYLDVWQRHITAIEDPEIREVALGGPDTTTRLKTVAQVKVLKKVGKIDCEYKIKGRWPPVLPLMRRGRLSTRDPELGKEDKPCITAPGGGYRGLENRLYRVEIHEGGEIINTILSRTIRTKKPTFKWSRDNGSVVHGVENFVRDDDGTSKKVLVKRLGKDQVLALKKHDLIEVLGDVTELRCEPGTLARIEDDPQMEKEINLRERLFVLNLDEDVSKHIGEKQSKVRRWDHGEKSDAELVNGAIQVEDGKWIELEDGIRILFEKGIYCPGDYWVFAARTATGKVERLDEAPPRGIEHHYCKLALITWQKDDEDKISMADPIYCRKIFPPLTELPKGGANCCTVTVGDGPTSVGDYTSIQEAIENLPQNLDGRICILPGVYRLETSVEINRDNLIIDGCGSQTQIEAKNGESAFIVHGDNVRLESLKVITSATEVAILVEECTNFRMEDCHVENTIEFYHSALQVVNSNKVMIIDNLLKGLPGLSLQAESALIDGNNLIDCGMWIWDASEEIRIKDNKTSGGDGPGIILGGLLDGRYRGERTGVSSVEILGNTIYNMKNSGISTCGKTPEDLVFEPIEDVTIAHNRIVDCAGRPPDPRFESLAVGGIVMRNVNGLRIYDNYIADNGRGHVAACGIFVDECAGLQVTGNTVTGNGSHRLGCMNFMAKGIPDKGRNPLEDEGVSFTVYDESGKLLDQTRIDVDPVFRLRGLDCEKRVLIKISSPVQIVKLTIASNFTDLGPIIKAFNKNGTSQEIEVEHNYQTIEIIGDDINYIEIGGIEKKAYILEMCAGTQIQGYQAGIVALNLESFNSTQLKFGGISATIQNNVVVCPGGQALILLGWGPMSITGNTLTSKARGELPIERSGVLTTSIGVSLPYGECVSIYNVGSALGLCDAFLEDENLNSPPTEKSIKGSKKVSKLGVAQSKSTAKAPSTEIKNDATFGIIEDATFGIIEDATIGRVEDATFLTSTIKSFFESISSSAAETVQPHRVVPTENFEFINLLENIPLHDGQVIFHDNQITLENPMAPRFIGINEGTQSILPPLLSGMSSVLISLDDLSIQNNQFLAYATWLPTNTIGLSVSQRLSGNRFVEKRKCAYSSCISYALLGSVITDNQATHCIFPYTPNLAFSDNQTLLHSLEECKEKSEVIRPLFNEMLENVRGALVKFLRTLAGRQAEKAEGMIKQRNEILKRLGEDHPSLMALDSKINVAKELEESLKKVVHRDSFRPKIESEEWMAFGSITDSKGEPVPNLNVRVFDKDRKYDDLLGMTKTNEYGDFYIKYRERLFQEMGEELPELYIMVEDKRGKLLYSSKDSILPSSGRVNNFKVELEKIMNQKRG